MNLNASESILVKQEPVDHGVQIVPDRLPRTEMCMRIFVPKDMQRWSTVRSLLTILCYGAIYVEASL